MSALNKANLLIGIVMAVLSIQLKATPNENTQYANQLLFPGTTEDNLRSKYQINLLKHALSYSDVNYSVKNNGQSIPTARNFKLLEENKLVQVLWSTSRNDREEDFMAVKIPLLKGLLGLRIALIQRHTPDLLRDVSTTHELASFSAGQLNSWSDSKILRHNGINVTNGVNFEALFKMLSLKRFDFFPRSVAEVTTDLARHKHLPIAIDKHLIIYYPNVMYFFVNKQNNPLHDEILNGLEKSIADGSFNRLFLSFHQQDIEKLQLRNRNIVHLNNPLLPNNTPFARPELWLNIIDISK